MNKTMPDRVRLVDGHFLRGGHSCRASQQKRMEIIQQSRNDRASYKKAAANRAGSTGITRGEIIQYDAIARRKVTVS